MAVFPVEQKALDYLSRKDKKLAAFIAATPLIEREMHDDLFEALISSIISQQVSGAAARTVLARLEQLAGGVTPQSVGALSTEQLRGCGLSGRKTEYIEGVTDSVLSGRLDLAGLERESDAVVVERLSALRGVGVWTAEMLLIFALGRPDVLSWGDLAIRRGIVTLYGLRSLTKEQFERYRRRYSPYGTTASLYLWEASHGIGIA